MNDLKKTITIAMAALFLFSGFSNFAISSENNVDTDMYIHPGILDMHPNGCYLGDFKEGETDSCEFVISNLGVSDPSEKVIYCDIEWGIDIPDMFKDHVTVSPNGGVLTAGETDIKTGEVVYDEDNSCTVTVDLDTTGLSSGIYKCDIEVVGDDGYTVSKIFSVKFSVDAPLLRTSPKKDTLNLGKPDIGEFTFEIWNGGFGNLEYDLDVSCFKTRYHPLNAEKIIPLDNGFREDWVSLSTNSGSSTGEKNKIMLSVDTSTLNEWTVDNSIGSQGEYYPNSAGGLYKCVIDINSNGANNEGKGKIVFTVKVGPKLEFSFEESNFGDLGPGDSETKTLKIWNKYNCDLAWEILIPESIKNYVNVTPVSGVSTGPDDICNVDITILNSGGVEDTTPLAKLLNDSLPIWSVSAGSPGYHHEKIYIKSNDPSSYYMPKPKNWPATGDKYFVWPSVDFEYYRSLCNPEDSYDMVIITADYFKNFPHSTKPEYDLEDLADAHRRIDGFNVTVKTIKEIYDSYFGVTYPTDSLIIKRLQLFNSKAVSLSIREFLRDAYFHWDHGSKKSFYVMLVGDDNWNMEVKEADSHPGLFFDESLYWQNIDYQWLKLGDYGLGNAIDMAPGRDSEYYLFSWGDDHYWNNSVEVPTFQLPTGGSSDPITSASDMPYSCLGSMYNPGLELNSAFETYYNLYDSSPDITVGRAPVRSAEELSNFVHKTISFMESSTTDEYKKAAVISEYLGLKTGETPSICVDENGTPIPCPDYYPESVVGGSDIFMWTWMNLTVDGVFSSNYLDDDFGLPGVASSDYNTVGIPSTNFDITILHDGYPDIGSGRAARLYWGGDDVVDLINEGIGTINHMGHAYRPGRGLDTLTGCWEEDPYELLRLNENDIKDHTIVDMYGNPIGQGGLKNTDTYPFVFSTGCYGGQFDNPYTKQIGELLITDENGAIAGVFNGMMMPDGESKSTKYNRMFWNAVFGKGIDTIGDAFNEMKKDTGNIDSNLFYGLNLFGDPALKIKGAEKITPEPEVEPEFQTFGKLNFNNTYEKTFEIYNNGSGKLLWNLEFGNDIDFSENPRRNLARLIRNSNDIENTLINDFLKIFVEVESDEGKGPYASEDSIYRSSGAAGRYKKTIRGSSVDKNDKTRVSVKLSIPGIDSCVSLIKSAFDLNIIWDYADDYNGFNSTYLRNLVKQCITSPFSLNIPLDYNYDGTTYQSDAKLVLLGNVEPPVLGDIPDQSIFVGDSFSDINLDSFVSDPDTSDSDIVWAVSGNGNISVDISWDNVASIGYPDGWTGCESVTFTATDDMGLSDSTMVTFEVGYDPDNNETVISMPSPVNGSTGIPIDIGMLSVNIADIDDDSFDWNITTVPDIGGSSVTGEYNGFKSCSISAPLSYNTSYEWVVSAVDYGSGRVNRSVFVFTTECDPNADNGDSDDGNGDGDSGGEGSTGGESTVNNAPVVSIVNPGNNSVDVSVNISEIEVDISDSEGDSFSWSISTVSDIGSNSDNGDVNGTKSCSVDDLIYNTSYSVFVNATDVGSGNTTCCVFSFTTESNNSDDDESDDSDSVDVSVDIVKPVDGGFYLLNKLRFSFFKTIVVGDLDFVAKVNGSETEYINNISFYVDDILIKNIIFDESKTNYMCSINRRLIGHHDIIVRATSPDDKIIQSDKKDMFFINFNIFE